MPMRKSLNAEIAIGFLVASVFWIGVVAWQSSYSPNENEKHQCEESARKSGQKSEECKTIWERTTSDPVALFTFGIFIFTTVLAVSTGFLWAATRDTARAGRRAAEISERALIDLERVYIFVEKIAELSTSKYSGQFRLKSKLPI